MRQWIELVLWTCKDQLGLERHGARIGLRLLALAVGRWHNHEITDPGRHFAAYGHRFGINLLACMQRDDLGATRNGLPALTRIESSPQPPRGHVAK